MTQRHAIITASDANCEDFLADHWLKSLFANVTLTNIDIIVIDYGLSDKRRSELDNLGVRRHIGVKDRDPVNARFRDMATILEDSDYDQILSTDCGDLIFQADVSHLFEEDTDTFRAACEEDAIPLYDVFISRGNFSPDRYREIAGFLRQKPLINVGVFLGPAAKMRDLWRQFQPLCRKIETWGTDQFLINHLFYCHGFRRLDEKFNFVIVSTRTPFTVRNGTFYDANGEIIPIVHNAGRYNAFRTIRRFGYGPGRNIPKRVTPKIVRGLIAVGKWWNDRRQNDKKTAVFAPEKSAGSHVS
ncbi:MAG: hypothetical protein WD738_02650 [Pirellulales bacterium]